MHFLVQSVPTNSVTKVVRTVKSGTAREVFRRSPGEKKQLWGGEFWSDGFFAVDINRFCVLVQDAATNSVRQNSRIATLRGNGSL